MCLKGRNNNILLRYKIQSFVELLWLHSNRDSQPQTFQCLNMTVSILLTQTQSDSWTCHNQTLQFCFESNRKVNWKVNRDKKGRGKKKSLNDVYFFRCLWTYMKKFNFDLELKQFKHSFQRKYFKKSGKKLALLKSFFRKSKNLWKSLTTFASVGVSKMWCAKSL